MPVAAITEDRLFRIRRNLRDAGCGEELIERFISLDSRQLRAEQYRLLGRHRAQLLDSLHREQYKIDCLDHMVYTMRREDDSDGGK